MADAMLVLYRFKQFGRGWDEEFYLPTDQITTAKADALNQTLLNNFVKIKHPSVLLGRVTLRRVWDGEGAKPTRATETIILNRPGQAATEDPTQQRPAQTVGAGTTLMAPFPDDFGTPDVTVTAAVCHLASQDGLSQRKLSIRGLPDPWTERRSETGAARMNAALGRAVNRLLGSIKNKFAIQTKKPPQGAYDWKDIEYIQPTENGANTLVKTFVAHGLQVGQLVDFSGEHQVPGMLGFRNTHRIIATGDDWFKVRVSYHLETEIVNAGPPIVEGNNILNFRCRRVAYTYETIRTAYFEDLASRDTGIGYERKRGRERGKSWRHVRKL